MSHASHDACADLREYLLTLDEGQALDPVHAEHVAGCAACAALHASLMEVDTALAELSPVEAPEDLVMRTLERLDAESAQPTQSRAGEQVDVPASRDARPGLLRGIFELVFGGFMPMLRSLFWPLQQLRLHPKLGSALVAGAALSSLLVFGTVFLTRSEKSVASVAHFEPQDDEENGPVASARPDDDSDMGWRQGA